MTEPSRPSEASETTGTTESAAPQPGQPEQPAWQRATGSAHFSVTAITDDTLRVAVARLDAPPHRTWSLAPEAAHLRANSAEVEKQGDFVSLRTEALRATFSVSGDGRSLQLRVT